MQCRYKDIKYLKIRLLFYLIASFYWLNKERHWDMEDKKFIAKIYGFG